MEGCICPIVIWIIWTCTGTWWKGLHASSGGYNRWPLSISSSFLTPAQPRQMQPWHNVMCSMRNARCSRNKIHCNAFYNYTCVLVAWPKFNQSWKFLTVEWVRNLLHNSYNTVHQTLTMTIRFTHLVWQSLVCIENRIRYPKRYNVIALFAKQIGYIIEIITPLRNHLPYGIWITQCYLSPGRGDFPASAPTEAVTRVSDPGGMRDARLSWPGW